MVLVPLPEVVVPPGVRVRVQPADGRPLNITLPVATKHVGCVIVPIVGVAGFCSNVIVTSSVDAVHGGLLIVHLNTYVVPAVPLKALVALVGVVMLPPAPDTMLQAPVPIVGVLPARVVLVSPHIVALVWSEPALAVVGF